MKGYSQIAESLVRFSVFDRPYSENTIVQQTLAIFYVDILKFHKEAYRFLRRSCKGLVLISRHDDGKLIRQQIGKCSL